MWEILGVKAALRRSCQKLETLKPTLKVEELRSDRVGNREQQQGSS